MTNWFQKGNDKHNQANGKPPGSSGGGPMDPQSGPPPGAIKVQIEVGDVEAIYSNLALLANSPSEFILDFARVEPGKSTAKVHARIIMTPQNAKALLEVLQVKITHFERSFGTIPTSRPGGPQGNIGGGLS